MMFSREGSLELRQEFCRDGKFVREVIPGGLDRFVFFEDFADMVRSTVLAMPLFV